MKTTQYTLNEIYVLNYGIVCEKVRKVVVISVSVFTINIQF